MAASVVYIEDRTSDAALVERVLSFLPDVRYVAAAEGKAGIVAARTLRPDVLLLDFKLPDINGNVVCRTIRANPNYRHMQIIIISGVADPDEVAELKAAGADEFIRKPFDINAVIGRIAEMMKVG